mmetsp:Transcript_62197/g.181590  ORF Transcript_62197/g.181590 Transcript_62197/m.181590 type:complete len:343 (+) Transcript_62197:1082-2110(+)
MPWEPACAHHKPISRAISSIKLRSERRVKAYSRPSSGPSKLKSALRDCLRSSRHGDPARAVSASVFLGLLPVALAPAVDDAAEPERPADWAEGGLRPPTALPVRGGGDALACSATLPAPESTAPPPASTEEPGLLLGRPPRPVLAELAPDVRLSAREELALEGCDSSVRREAWPGCWFTPALWWASFLLLSDGSTGTVVAEELLPSPASPCDGSLAGSELIFLTLLQDLEDPFADKSLLFQTSFSFFVARFWNGLWIVLSMSQSAAPSSWAKKASQAFLDTFACEAAILLKMLLVVMPVSFSMSRCRTMAAVSHCTLTKYPLDMQSIHWKALSSEPHLAARM